MTAALAGLAVLWSAAWSVQGAEVLPRTVVTLGVQAVVQTDAEHAQWQPLVQGLGRALPQYDFRLNVLPWPELVAAVQAGQVQFAVTSPAHYVLLETRYGAARLASQVAERGGNTAHVVGTAVVVPADSPVQQLTDVRGQRVAAVAADAFGGYQLAAVQWQRQGLDTHPGAAEPLFTGYPMERVVQAVRQGRAHAGVLRLCVLEQMVARGEVAAGALRVLPPLDGGAPTALGCAASSATYPGWAFSAMTGTPRAVADAVLLALLTESDQSLGSHWGAPADYQPVHAVLRALQVEPYGAPQSVGWAHVLWEYRRQAGIVALLLLLVAAYLWHVEVLVKRRTAALQRSLQERDALALQVAQAHERMDHMGRLSVLGELSATLAHELSHPLASLSNYVGGLRRRQQAGCLSPTQLDLALEAMDSETGRTLRVLDSVRALARKRVSVKQRAALWPLVCESVELLQAMSAMGAQGPRVVLDCPEALRTAEVLMDAQQIQQVLLNLLQNARDAHAALPAGADPIIHIRLALQAEPPALVLAVCDQGPPIAPATWERWFEPFYTTKPGGLGLGLAISRSMAELHGGQLQAHPGGADGGLRMELVLPTALPLSMNKNAISCSCGALEQLSK